MGPSSPFRRDLRHAADGPEPVLAELARELDRGRVRTPLIDA